MSCIPVIIPAYEPDDRLIDLLDRLQQADIGPVIVVNDGSGPAYEDIFGKTSQLLEAAEGCLLIHEVNKGKGRALKTAFEYVLKTYPEALGVVTADSDGQHSPECIARIIDALKQHPDKLILGVRSFDGEDIPWKSRMGNKLTEKVVQYVCGTHISDTQTGLRGLPISCLPDMLAVQGDRFEYEMRTLLEAVDTIGIVEIPIKTIYDSKENHTTHFNAVTDSIKIYKILGARFFAFMFSSLSSSLVDLLLFALFAHFLKASNPDHYAAIATVVARIFSAVYNYTINYKLVFKSKENVLRASIKYAALAVGQMCVSAGLLDGLVHLIPVVPAVVLKLVVDTVLFFISYKIQQRFVFRGKE